MNELQNQKILSQISSFMGIMDSAEDVILNHSIEKDEQIANFNHQCQNIADCLVAVHDAIVRCAIAIENRGN